VLGECGQRAVTHATLGSTTTRVGAESVVPVLAVPLQYRI
jgi:nucleotide-binding universal stress UspA family protein